MTAVLRANREGRYLDANDEALALLGVSIDDVRGAPVGTFSGPNAEIAFTIWRRLAAHGEDMSTGESTLYRPDGTRIRVRYVRIEAVSDEVYELEVELIGAEGDASVDEPPIADRPSTLLREWRAAEREAAAATISDGPGAMAAPADAEHGAESLRELYQHSVAHRVGKDLVG
jgi:PAS domain-containing protein